MWNKEDKIQEKGTETAEEQDVWHTKECNKAAEGYNNLSKEQKNSLSQLNYMRKQINGGRFKKEEWRMDFVATPHTTFYTTEIEWILLVKLLVS
jgi:hypothetical protein